MPLRVRAASTLVSLRRRVCKAYQISSWQELEGTFGGQVVVNKAPPFWDAVVVQILLFTTCDKFVPVPETCDPSRRRPTSGLSPFAADVAFCGPQPDV